MVSPAAVSGACAVLAAAFGLMVPQGSHPCTGKDPIECARIFKWDNVRHWDEGDTTLASLNEYRRAFQAADYWRQHGKEDDTTCVKVKNVGKSFFWSAIWTRQNPGKPVVGPRIYFRGRQRRASRAGILGAAPSPLLTPGGPSKTYRRDRRSPDQAVEGRY